MICFKCSIFHLLKYNYIYYIKHPPGAPKQNHNYATIVGYPYLNSYLMITIFYKIIIAEYSNDP